ncbi:MAG: hypothetical protein O3B95_12645, partial [Chloroflexi bacterium]|nr:hypothetical protein [Chloroflexota bacterium]
TSHSGGYGAVLALGRIPIWLIGPVIFVVYPHASAEHARGGELKGLYRDAVGISLVIMTVCVAGFYVGAKPILTLWKPEFASYAHLVWPYALAMGADAIIQVIINVELARHRYRVLWLLAVPSLLTCVLIYMTRHMLTLELIVAALAGTRLLILLGLLLVARVKREGGASKQSG